MFFLHTSNRTENLAHRLADIIAQDHALSLFSGELFLIQSRGMERMLSQYLAGRFQVWCSGSYLLPLQFIDYLSSSFGLRDDYRLFERDLLTWRLERLLRKVDDPVLRPIAAYLKSGREDMKRYQFARQLAHLFDQYQILRLDRLKLWESGAAAGSSEYEQWQGCLWRKLRDDAPGVPHRGEAVLSLIESINHCRTAEKLVLNRLFVFGLHTMPPLFLGVINELSRIVDVHLFLLSPCMEYWGDVESRRLQLGRRLQKIRAGSLPTPADMAFHPLLAGLGRQGADFQELLLETVEGLEEGPELFSDPLADGARTLLHRLQADVLANAEEPGRPVESDRDDSIMVVSCHSRMREVQVLRDQIMCWLYSDSTLGLHDILVMAPDIEKYAPFIPAVFRELPHDIADKQSRRTNGFLDAFLQFLNLFSSRYGWNDVLGLLERPEVLTRFDLSGADFEILQNWVIKAGVRWGLSALQRVEDGLHAFDAGTWRAGLERMLMGYAVGSEDEIDGIVPFTDIEGSQAELLGRLCQFIGVIEQARQDFRIDRRLADWSERFAHYSSQLFIDDQLPEQLELLSMISSLAEEPASCHDEELSLAVVRSWLETRAETKSSSGFLAGRITFCSMLPMRSIPFRVICLLGLNDGEFPNIEAYPPYDLLGWTYEKGDRSRRADDRYQFLEAILAAREHLYISYIGQSIKTNRISAPSIVVSELLDVLQSYHGVNDMTTFHPLHTHSSDYFRAETQLFSFDERACRIAAALNEPVTSTRSAWIDGDLEILTESRISLSDLISFITRPQVYFLQNIMGIYLDAGSRVPDAHELFGIDGLDQYAAEQEIAAGLLQEQSADVIVNRLQKKLRWPLAAPGKALFDRELPRIAAFARNVSAAGAGVPKTSKVFELGVGAVAVSGTLDNIHDGNLVFYRLAKLKGRDVLAAWLSHLIAARVLDKPPETRIVTDDGMAIIERGAGSEEDLLYLITLFQHGNRKPSPLFVEPAMAYAEQVITNRGRGRISPLDKARQRYVQEIDRGFCPERELLYRDTPIDQILGEVFESICTCLVLPVRERLRIETRKEPRRG